MTPLDDELRRALSERAVRLQPARDPLAGIEQRARRMRRNRLASVAAAVALFTGGAAVAVPALIDAGGGSDASPSELLTPSPDPTPSASPSPVALPFVGEQGRLDPAAPWAYRGSALPAAVRTSFAAEWTSRYPAASFVPLFGQVWAPSGNWEVLFLSRGTGQGDLWGVMQESGSGPDVPWVQPLPSPTTALAAALGGDEGVARVLVVAAPQTTRLFYSPQGDDAGAQALAPLEPGVGTLAMEGSPARDQVLASQGPLPGGLVYRALAPDLPGQAAEPGTSPISTPTAPARPDSALDWPGGALSSEDLDGRVRTAYAQRAGVAEGDVAGDQLWLGLLPDGTQVGWYQLWTANDDPEVFLARALPNGGAELGRTNLPTPELTGLADVAVDGDGRPWVVALGAPGVSDIAYAENGTQFVLLEMESRSVVFPRTGPTGSTVDKVRIRQPGDSLTVDLATRGQVGEPEVSGFPSNAVTWPLRGSLTNGPDLIAAKAAIAQALGGKAADLTLRPLLATDFDGGLRLVAGQAWLAGQKAHPVSYAVGGTCPASTFVGREIPARAGVLAFALDCVPGRTVETVMVVPQPRTGQVSYGAQDSEYRDLGFLPGLEPVVELERDAAGTRGDDRLRVLDGNGDLDDPVYEGPLQALLCGLKECG